MNHADLDYAARRIVDRALHAIKRGDYDGASRLFGDAAFITRDAACIKAKEENNKWNKQRLRRNLAISQTHLRS